MKKTFLLLLLVPFALVSCEDILGEDGDLSSDDVVKGLKTALNIGTDSSTTILSATNGYYGDALVKIPLPKEAMAIKEKMDYVRKYSSTAASVIDGKMEDLILAINRSAEEAAKDAAPIFSSAITNLSIVDGLQILNGEVPGESLKSAADFDSLAATKYLKNQTYNSLVDAYAPKMDDALGKKLVGNASATSLPSCVSYSLLLCSYFAAKVAIFSLRDSFFRWKTTLSASSSTSRSAPQFSSLSSTLCQV